LAPRPGSTLRPERDAVAAAHGAIAAQEPIAWLLRLMSFLVESA
jgi:hypothetical protein